MSNLDDIKKTLQQLSPQELAEFRAWFLEFDELAWDQQIEADSRAGKLGALAAEALAEHRAGKTRETF